MVDYYPLWSFRNDLYGCFGNGRDALMDVCDALLCESGARSFAELSESPFFHRLWPSLYEAFDDGRIDRSKLQRLFVRSLPAVSAGKRRVLAADVSSIPRPESPTARDRSYVHVPNAPKGAKPVSPGWQYATVAALPEEPSSWTIILDNRRISTQETPGQVVAQQLHELAPQLPEETIVDFDGAFGNVKFVKMVHTIRLGKLMRIAKNRTFYKDVPPADPSVKRPPGHPVWHGAVFALNKPETHPPPDEAASGVDRNGHPVQVDAWHGWHFAGCHEASLSVIRITRRKGQDTKRSPRVTWYIWQGPHRPPVDQIPGYYALRYCIEHSYRFEKQQMLWAEPRLRTPEKHQTWTDIVAAAHNQITLARQYQQEKRHSWAKRNTKATPQQVRAGMAGIIALLGTPARPAQPRGKAPGRPLGAVVKKAERFNIVYKAAAKTAKAGA